MTVPRTDTPSKGILGNIEALTRSARNLGVMGGEIEFGYNLMVFPDEPVTVADLAQAQAQNDANPIQKWIQDLTSPIQGS